MREGNSGIDLVKAITRLSFSVPLPLRLSLPVLFLSYLFKKQQTLWLSGHSLESPVVQPISPAPAH